MVREDKYFAGADTTEIKGSGEPRNLEIRNQKKIMDPHQTPTSSHTLELVKKAGILKKLSKYSSGILKFLYQKR